MKSRSVLRGLTSALLGGAAFAVVSTSAMAADLGSYKDGPMEAAPAGHTITVNGGVTTDYVFRGISQSDEGPAVFAGVDIAYGMFYAGVWASSVDDFTSDGNIEIDYYGGIKKSYNGVDFDLGVLYYSYPSNDAVVDLNYLEFKAAASAKVWRELTLTGTVFYSPEYYGETGDVWTFEGKAAVPLPIWGISLSGTLGTVVGDDEFEAANGFDQYTYWNVGLSKTFRDHFTVDVHYWDTDVDAGEAIAPLGDLADERIVATFTFNY